MTQLSPFSQSALLRIQKLLFSFDKLTTSIRTNTRHIFMDTLPAATKNIRYTLTLLKDITSLLPSQIYKTIAAIVFLSFVVKYLRRARKHKKQEQERKVKQTRQIQSQTLKMFQQLGPEFQVRESLGPTGPGYTLDQEEQDSCCEDLTHQLHESHDFRDVVFFELMKGYSEAAKNHHREEKEEACTD